MESSRYNLKSTQQKMRMLGFRVDGTSTDLAEVQTVTMPAVAAAAQADYIVLENQAGVKYAFWIDIDDDGTEPTGAAYLAADDQIRLDLTTGDDAIDAGAILTTAAAAMADVTVVDNLDGTVTFTQDDDGPTADPIVHDEDDSGNGSITAVVDTQGVLADASILEGTYDATFTDNGTGDYTLTFAEAFKRTPVVSIGMLTEDTIHQISAVSTTAVTIKTFAANDGVTAKDADFHVHVMGDMAPDAR